MRTQPSTKQWLGTASVLALSTTAFLSTAAPAQAQAISAGIYAGGSTLASQAFRQIFDCYSHTPVGGDGFTTTSPFTYSPPMPGFLPTTCPSTHVQGMYAGVGSGNGFRGYITNKPSQWYGGTVNAGSTISPPFPSSPPPFVDSANSTNFGTYPFPRVDIGLSDSPLPSTVASISTAFFNFTPSTNWSTAGGPIAA